MPIDVQNHLGAGVTQPLSDNLHVDPTGHDFSGVESLLSAEGRPIDEAMPWAFSIFLSEMLMGRNNQSVAIVDSSEAVRAGPRFGGPHVSDG